MKLRLSQHLLNLEASHFDPFIVQSQSQRFDLPPSKTSPRVTNLQLFEPFFQMFGHLRVLQSFASALGLSEYSVQLF